MRPWSRTMKRGSLVVVLVSVPLALALSGLSPTAQAGPPKKPEKKEKKAEEPQKVASADVQPREGAAAIREGSQLLYTTYFYTAGEAIIHGYEKDTNAKILSLDQGGKSIWSGTVGDGETVLVPTGQGVFGFQS